MAFLGDEGKLTRFGDVARVADWIVSHKPKTVLATASAPAPTAPARNGRGGSARGADRSRRRPLAPRAPPAPLATATP